MRVRQLHVAPVVALVGLLGKTDFASTSIRPSSVSSTPALLSLGGPRNSTSVIAAKKLAISEH